MLKTWPNEILNTLKRSGFEAYYVGGCVRDYLLKRPCQDWDITTAARPEQVLELFEQTEPTGMKHGTITVYADGVSAEVTTFRADGKYVDGRHPQQVTFVSTLHEDLVRRDFTVNALAMDADGNINDFFGGLDDLNRKIIRCIGDPVVRFQEDALRIFRAYRFSAQLGFEIDFATKDGAAACADLCKAISVERTVEELEKILLSDHPQVIEELVGIGALQKMAIGSPKAVQELVHLPRDPVVRWAALCARWKDLDIRQLHLDKKTTALVFAVSNMQIPTDRIGWKRCLSQHGAAAASLLATINRASDSIEEILASGECYSVSGLAVKGSDFPNLKGKAVGELLHRILEDVLLHPENNDREKILKKFIN